MGYILYIDTSSDTGLTSLSKDGTLISSVEHTDTRNHASVINNDINTLLSGAGISISNLSAIAVCGGPGSYTGLRIGLATAKALCYVVDIPLMLHHRLALLAAGQIYADTSYNAYMSVLPARAKEYFAAVYDKDFNPLTEPQHFFDTELEEIINDSPEKTLVTGQVDEFISATATRNDLPVTPGSTIHLDSWVKYAEEQYNCNGFVTLASAEPYYLKQVYTHKPKNIK